MLSSTQQILPVESFRTGPGTLHFPGIPGFVADEHLLPTPLLSAVVFCFWGSGQDGSVAQGVPWWPWAGQVQSCCGPGVPEHCFAPSYLSGTCCALGTEGTGDKCGSWGTAQNHPALLTCFPLSPETRIAQTLTCHLLFAACPSSDQLLPSVAAFPSPHAACHQTHSWATAEMVPQTPAPQPGLILPASLGQEESIWSSPQLLGSGRCFLPLRSP